MIFIAGDWGTTKLRLALCDEDGIRERRDGPGTGQTAQPPEAVFAALSADWRREHGPIPVVLCGTVGARNGWREVPYLPCPADPRELARGAATLGETSILPGLSCVNPLGAPDVMRGEETQILGALSLRPELSRGRHLLGLPGTHTKWAELENGAVRRFLTAPTGEIFALLRGQSTLTKVGPPAIAGSRAGFTKGLAREGDLLQTVFETRTRQLIDAMTPEDALGFLSGLLIGADVGGALKSFPGFSTVLLIGEPSLTSLYAEALSFHTVISSALDGGDCAFAGLRSIIKER